MLVPYRPESGTKSANSKIYTKISECTLISWLIPAVDRLSTVLCRLVSSPEPIIAVSPMRCAQTGNSMNTPIRTRHFPYAGLYLRSPKRCGASIVTSIMSLRGTEKMKPVDPNRSTDACFVFQRLGLTFPGSSPKRREYIGSATVMTVSYTRPSRELLQGYQIPERFPYYWSVPPQLEPKHRDHIELA